jgi:UDP-N-acetylglucosamine 2-epimerase
MEALDRSPLPCLFAAHPRSAAALGRLGVSANGRVRVSAPVGYLESLALVRQATAVVTDSGGLQREAYWLGVPCVTVRHETEWVETVELGANRLIPPAQAAALPDLIGATTRQATEWDRTAYGDGHAAELISADVARRYPSLISS